MTEPERPGGQDPMAEPERPDQVDPTSEPERPDQVDPTSEPDRPRVSGDLVDGPPPDLVAYLRRYGDEYTREAMAARLIEAGHDPGVVEAALEELDTAAPTAVAVDEHEQARVVARVIVGIAFAGLALWLLGIAPRDAGAAGFSAAAVALAVLFGGGAIWWLGRVRSVGAMVAIAMLAVLVGLPLTFLGACIAWVNTGGTLF